VEKNKPDIALIRKYLNGELDARAMYELERRAQDDPYLMDVLMGMEMGNETEDEDSLATIDQLLGQRVQMVQTKKMIPWKSWSIAASMVIGVSVLSILFFRQPAKQAAVISDQQLVQSDKTIVAPELAKETLLNKPAIAKNLPAGLTLATVSKNKLSSGKARVTASDEVNPIVSNSTMARMQTPAAQGRIDANIINPAASADVIAANKTIDTAVFGKVSEDRLNEVVVVGYGIPKNKSVATAAVAAKLQPPLAEQALAGKVAGTEIKNSDLMKDTLYEVVVTGFKVPEKRAQPITGWKAFNAYLKVNAKSSDGKVGVVTIAFTIDASGIPAQVVIRKGVNAVLNKKAEELILNGPRWIGDSDGRPREITLKIKFK
jgi:hypothetical protein